MELLGLFGSLHLRQEGGSKHGRIHCRSVGDAARQHDRALRRAHFNRLPRKQLSELALEAVEIVLHFDVDGADQMALYGPIATRWWC